MRTDLFLRITHTYVVSRSINEIIRIISMMTLEVDVTFYYFVYPQNLIPRKSILHQTNFAVVWRYVLPK